MFFGCMASAVHLFISGGGMMDINYVKDVLFDLINESDALDVADIQYDDDKGLFLLVMKDGSVFALRVVKVKE